MNIPFLHHLKKAVFLALLALPTLLFATNMKAQTAVPLKIGIIGDSTVNDYPPGDSHRGWGQTLPEFFQPDVRILNQAKPGASTKTFPADRWKKILDFKADFILIQFGHNDQHDKSKPEATDAGTDYRENLRRYVRESRENGATPILITPMHRRTFDTAQHVTTELQPYADAMIAVGQELNVPVVDLYTESGVLFEKLGEEGGTALTLNNIDHVDRPGKGDRTHFTKEGALEIARLVAGGLTKMDPKLKAALRNP